MMSPDAVQEKKSLSYKIVEAVKLLSDGCCYDGSSIGGQLNMTRTEVRDLMKKLKQYGVLVTYTRDKGYCLQESLILLDAHAISKQLDPQSVDVRILAKTTSTNDYLKELAPDNKKMIVCLAEMQTAGRGRLNRKWHSPFSKNIHLSLLYPFKKQVSELSGLSLVTVLAVCRAIEATVNLTDDELKVKWPNDILINGRKLSGILIEMRPESNGCCQAVIGIGVNVNMRSALKEYIDQPWTSLFNVTHGYIDRNILCAAIIAALISNIDQFLLKGLSSFKEVWQKRDALMNVGISVLSNGKQTTGIGTGINPQGHLKIKIKDGNILTFSSGDTTVLK
jgi:BirA family biotin operon repressor/biotin-[acetyl-CoA-carboxylase] ligase